MDHEAMAEPIAPKQPHSVSDPRKSRMTFVMKKEMDKRPMPRADSRVNMPRRRPIPQDSSMNGRAHPKAIASGPGNICIL